jgi:hypothetical protein
MIVLEKNSKIKLSRWIMRYNSIYVLEAYVRLIFLAFSIIYNKKRTIAYTTVLNQRGRKS